MGQNRHRGTKSNWILILTVLVCLATGALGIVVYVENKHIIHKATLLSTIVAELINLLLVPFCVLAESPTVNFIISIAIIISSLASLGAGLSYFYTLMNQVFDGFIPSNPKVFISFISLFLASLMALGIQLGQCLQPDLYITPSTDSIKELGYMSNYETSSHVKLKNKFVNVKPPPDTLVEKGSQILDDHLLIHQSETSTLNSKHISNTFTNKSKNSAYSNINYSMKNLSVINQSISPINPSKCISLTNNCSVTSTPTRIIQPNKNMILERNIKKMSSVLLPPHPRVFDGLELKNELQMESKLEPAFEFRAPSTSKQHMAFKSRSQEVLNSENIKEELIQMIPRAATLEDMWPITHERTQGIKTISLEEWEQNQLKFKHYQLRGISDSFKPFQKPQQNLFESIHEAPMLPITDEESIISMITADRQSTPLPESLEPQDNGEDSTEQALRFVEDIHELTMEDDELLKSAIDITQSTLHLEDLELTQLSMQKTKSHSPCKSFFKNHSNRSSNSSFNLKTQLTPTSPRKRSVRSFPKKRYFKNLSLPSISLKVENEDIPNFSYVHELQSSPSKKRASVDNMHHYSNSDVQQTSTPIKSNFALKFSDQSKHIQKTPESNWSSGSKKSVFPSEVIGEYDKEKWKTMQRLDLI